MTDPVIGSIPRAQRIQDPSWLPLHFSHYVNYHRRLFDSCHSEMTKNYKEYVLCCTTDSFHIKREEDGKVLTARISFTEFLKSKHQRFVYQKVIGQRENVLVEYGKALIEHSEVKDQGYVEISRCYKTFQKHLRPYLKTECVVSTFDVKNNNPAYFHIRPPLIKKIEFMEFMTNIEWADLPRYKINPPEAMRDE